MNAAGEPVYVVQQRLTAIAVAYGAHAATVDAFPIYLMVTIGRGAPAVVEVTTSLSDAPRLDQIAALERLLPTPSAGRRPRRRAPPPGRNPPPAALRALAEHRRLLGPHDGAVPDPATRRARRGRGGRVRRVALLSFGILAGIEAVGIPSSQVLFGREGLLGPWAPWLGVLVFAAGVIVAHSAPAASFPALLVVLYAAWTGQVLTNELVGGYVGTLVGAAVMTIVSDLVSRFPSAMSAHASFSRGLAAGPRRARPDRADGARRRTREPGPRGDDRLDLRRRPRRAVRYAAPRVGRRHRPRRQRRDRGIRCAASMATTPRAAFDTRPSPDADDAAS